jgi:hypothetical protein
MPERQINLGLDAPYTTTPVVVPELRDEIAQAWGLPLGERIQVRLRDSQCDTLTGTLELATAPDFPWNPREPLQLRIASFPFSSRVIESWSRP